MLYRKINVELIVVADEAEAVVGELNAALDRMDEKHTLFGVGIETLAIENPGTRKNWHGIGSETLQQMQGYNHQRPSRRGLLSVTSALKVRAETTRYQSVPAHAHHILHIDDPAGYRDHLLQLGIDPDADPIDILIQLTDYCQRLGPKI
jgi:hypothetical protein